MTALYICIDNIAMYVLIIVKSLCHLHNVTIWVNFYFWDKYLSEWADFFSQVSGVIKLDFVNK